MLLLSLSLSLCILLLVVVFFLLLSFFTIVSVVVVKKISRDTFTEAKSSYATHTTLNGLIKNPKPSDRANNCD